MGLEINFGTMIAQLAIFGILLLLVRKYALRPMLETMQERQDLIQGEIAKAEQNRLESESLLQKQNEELEKSWAEARDIVESAKAQKNKEAEEIILSARHESERMLTEASVEIDRQKEKALESLRNELGELTTKLASRVLQDKVDSSVNSQLIASYLEEVGGDK